MVAVIAEPVQGAGSVIVLPDSYLEELRQIAVRHNVLLIFGEVIIGFGRTGDMFGARGLAKQEIVGFVDGVGLFGRIELVRNRDSRAVFAHERAVADRIARWAPSSA